MTPPPGQSARTGRWAGIISRLIALLLCGVLPGQDFSPKDRPEEIPSQSLTPLDKAFLLRHARAALCGEDVKRGKAPPNCSKGSGQEVFVTVYGPDAASLRTRAAGGSFADAVRRAAVQARVDPAFVNSGLDKPDRVRIKIDVLAARELLFPHPSLNVVLEMAPGLDGVEARKGDAKGYVLPGEIIAKQLTGRSRLLETACTDAGLPADAWQSLNTEVLRIRTIAFMESCAGGTGGEYVDLYRAVPLPGKPTRSLVDSAALAAGRWLMSAQSDDGSFASFYAPFDNHYERKVYNVVRHAEATLALLELCRKTKDEKLWGAARQAVKFLARHIVADKPEEFCYIYENVFGRLGPSALALLVLLEHRAVTEDTKYDDRIRALGRFLRYMQKEDGSFFPIYEFKKRVDRPDVAHRIYPGQALLALVRLYRFTNDEAVLDAALRCADYVMNRRDADLRRKEPLEDPWAAIGLCELHAISGDLAHAEYCLNIAEAIRRRVFGRDRTPFLDYLGGSDHGTDTGNPPNVTATAVRLRAMNAACALARRMKVPSEGYDRTARDMVQFLLRNQFTVVNSYYVPHAERCLGGFRLSFIEHKIELECVAHSLSALLGATGQVAGDG
ncbi:MAG: AMMECR1 domain-containing protein [Planctomycetes bacterium]|nr:AMMECR1 domain-containing protein [Planctomycetota bacterium]